MKKSLSFPSQSPYIYLLGPALVSLVALIMFLLRPTPFYIPNPVSLLVFSVIITAFVGGHKPGLLAALAACLYLLFSFSIPGSAFQYDDVNMRRLIAWSICFPGIALIVGLLKTRSEARLQRELNQRILQEEDLRASESRIRAIINSAYDSFIAIDQQSRILEWNPQAERTFGWSRKEAIGRLLSELIIPEGFREAHLMGINRYNETGEGAILNRRIEVPARHKNGNILAMELTVYPIVQKDSTLFGAFLHDISERKRIEQLSVIQLNSSRIINDYASVAETLPLLLKELCQGVRWDLAEMWMTDASNSPLRRVVLWSGDKDLQQLFEDKNAPISLLDGFAGIPLTDTTPHWKQNLELPDFPRSDQLREAGIKTLLYCNIKNGEQLIGTVVLYNRTSLKQDHRLMDLLYDFCKRLGNFVLRRRAEQELRDLSLHLEQKIQERTKELDHLNQQLKEEAVEKEILYEQARTANRLKDEFLATISHELRTPMNVILGHSELLHEEVLNPTEQKKSIDAIYRNTKAQVHIVSDILDVSRFITGKVQMNMEVVNMAEIVSASVESIAAAASAKDIEVIESISTDIGYITGDPTRLQQVLWNLLSNAVKFTPRHGKIQVSLNVAESNVVVTIKDNGKGIEPNFLPYVFDRFRQEDSTTTRRFGGLGLGLAITKNIVEAHGGSIQVASEGRGLGATFSVILPITAIRSHTEFTKSAAENDTVSLEGLHVLVVDDQEDALALVGTLLKRVGAKVTTANNATDGFKKLIRIRPDVLISDIGMPEKDGYDLIEMVRKLPKEMGGKTLALALTAYAQEEDQKKTLEKGFHAHLAKPIEGKKLLRAVAKLAGRRPPPTSH